MLSPSVDTLAVALPTHNCACHHHVHENDNTHWHSCPRRTKPLATGHHAIATASPQGSLAGRLVVGRSNCALASGRSAAMGKGQARFKRWWVVASSIRVCLCVIRPSVHSPLPHQVVSAVSHPVEASSPNVHFLRAARCSIARCSPTDPTGSIEHDKVPKLARSCKLFLGMDAKFPGTRPATRVASNAIILQTRCDQTHTSLYCAVYVSASHWCRLFFAHFSDGFHRSAAVCFCEARGVRLIVCLLVGSPFLPFPSPSSAPSSRCTFIRAFVRLVVNANSRVKYFRASR